MFKRVARCHLVAARCLAQRCLVYNLKCVSSYRILECAPAHMVRVCRKATLMPCPELTLLSLWR